MKSMSIVTGKRANLMHFSQDHLLIIQTEKKYHTGYWALESSILQINDTICRLFAVLIYLSCESRRKVVKC